MMGEAGSSVAYHAKPKVREQAMVAINSGGLTGCWKFDQDRLPNNHCKQKRPHED
jgi:phosphoserine phosphatase